MGKLVGYARVSSNDQNLNTQVDALLSAGVKRQYLFLDQVSGAKTERPGLEECLNSLERGDSLLVWRLDRLDRSMQHLVEDLRQKGVCFKSLCDGAIDKVERVGHLPRVIDSQSGNMVSIPLVPKVPNHPAIKASERPKNGENKESDPQTTYDVIVVGTGQAGFAAAVAASTAGARVLVLESESTPGGTSLRSGGHLWWMNLQKSKQMAQGIYNALGSQLIDPAYQNFALPTPGFDLETPALQYGCFLAYPEAFNANYQYFGVPPDTYNFVKTFYEQGAPIWEGAGGYLQTLDALRVAYNTQTGSSDPKIVYDTDVHGVAAGFTVLEQAGESTYTVTRDTVVPGSWGTINGWGYSVDQAPGYQGEETDYWYRTRVPAGSCPGRGTTYYYDDGSYSNYPDTQRTNVSNTGQWLTDPFKHYQSIYGNFQLNSRVKQFKETALGVQLTVELNAADGGTPTITTYIATKGVVFATGGFSANQELLEDNYLTGNLMGTCSAPGSRGDLVYMAQENKLNLVHMKDAFVNQKGLDPNGKTISTPYWHNWFAANFTVNKLGLRVYAETCEYSERAKHQMTTWSPTLNYLDRFLFIVLDRMEYNNLAANTYTFPGCMTFSVTDDISPDLKIPTICQNIVNYFNALPDLANFGAGIDLNTFITGFTSTLFQYNNYCTKGIDAQFQRHHSDNTRNYLGFIRQAFNPTFTKDSPVTEASDWRYNSWNIANPSSVTSGGPGYGPNVVQYFNTLMTGSPYTYTYPDSHTYPICPDIIMQPVLDPVVIVIVPSTLDTKGGPLVDANQRIVGTKGCYAAGNCGGIATLNQAYMSGGATLAPGLMTGWKAGLNAYNNSLLNLDDQYASNLKVINVMGNAYPVRTLSLTLSDPVPIVIAVTGAVSSNVSNAVFKLSLTRHESIPLATSVNQTGWASLPLTLLSTQGNIAYYQLTLPGNTFTLSGIYYVTIQLAYQGILNRVLSLGPPNAIEITMKVLRAPGTLGSRFVDENLPSDALKLTLASNPNNWSGRCKSNTASGFVEVKNNQDIYLNFRKPDHNFRLSEAFEFDSLAKVKAFADLVYPDKNVDSVGNHVTDVLKKAAKIFNFTFDPYSKSEGSKPNVLHVAQCDQTYQKWFAEHYDVAGSGHKFPRYEMVSHAQLSTTALVKNWHFNKTLTREGKYTVYFYCSENGIKSDQYTDYGWFVVLP